ncbi:MAG TPA: hypothetical protein VIN59_09320 [Alphaproteobacteria bacterium]
MTIFILTYAPDDMPVFQHAFNKRACQNAPVALTQEGKMVVYTGYQPLPDGFKAFDLVGKRLPSGAKIVGSINDAESWLIIDAQGKINSELHHLYTTAYELMVDAMQSANDAAKAELRGQRQYRWIPVLSMSQ